MEEKVISFLDGVGKGKLYFESRVAIHLEGVCSRGKNCRHGLGFQS